MTVKVQLFAMARQLGGESIQITVPQSATVRDLRQRIVQEYPTLAAIVTQSMIAIDSEYADDDEAVPEGAEVACIPPVSGGSEDYVQLTEGEIDYPALVERVRTEQAGAVVSFLGTTRQFTSGRRTSSLDYEAYPAMAKQKISEVVTEARARWPLEQTAVVHRLGHLELGEISVAIALSSRHRAEAFAACQYIMDRIKQVVPIWKCENWSDGSKDWVHPGLESPSVQTTQSEGTSDET